MKIYKQTTKATTNTFGLHTQPRKTTRYTNILKVMLGGGGEGKRTFPFFQLSYMLLWLDAWCYEVRHMQKNLFMTTNSFYNAKFHYVMITRNISFVKTETQFGGGGGGTRQEPA